MKSNESGEQPETLNPLQAFFITKLKAEYTRNQHSSSSSSSGGRKNLKCFPQCTKQTHAGGVTCSSSILVEYIQAEQPSVGALVSFGRFSCVTGDTGPCIPVGDTTDIPTTAESSPDTWWKGTPAKVDGKNVFVFNETGVSWHYGVPFARTSVDRTAPWSISSLQRPMVLEQGLLALES
jgi:hypothetical protein